MLEAIQGILFVIILAITAFFYLITSSVKSVWNDLKYAGGKSDTGCDYIRPVRSPSQYYDT